MDNRNMEEEVIASTISMIIPKDCEPESKEFYKMFYRKYSIYMGFNAILCTILEDFGAGDGAEFVDDSFRQLNGVMDDYRQMKVIRQSMMLNVDGPQFSEKRGICSGDVYRELLSSGIDRVSILKGFINISEFSTIHAIFEGSITSECSRVGAVKDKNFSSANLMKNLDLLLKEEIRQREFSRLFQERTGLSDYGFIKEIWGFFNEVRNMYGHTGGYLSSHWKNKIDDRIKIIKEATKKMYDNKNIIILIEIMDEIDNFLESKSDILLLSDKMVNFFRNYIITLMESLYMIDDSTSSV